MTASTLLEQKIQSAYQAVPDHVRDDILEALLWAKAKLTEHEGAGHQIYISAVHNKNLVCCSFAKPEWPGDHCGRGMPHGAEAVVMAVCEYLSGA